MLVYALRRMGEEGLDGKPMELFYDFASHKWKVFDWSNSCMPQLTSRVSTVEHYKRMYSNAEIVSFTLTLKG